MIGMGLVALIANVVCLILISKHRKGEVHMRASWLFSKNDVIANLGVILAGVLVGWSGSRMPDLIIGFVVALIVFRGGMHILKDARETNVQNSCSDS
jgi:Co/Zn/Cd efflux system component